MQGRRGASGLHGANYAPLLQETGVDGQKTSISCTVRKKKCRKRTDGENGVDGLVPLWYGKGQFLSL